MRARRTGAALATLIILLAGLTTGLELGDSAAQTSAPSGTQDVAPAAQTGVVEPQAVTGPGVGVPTTSVATQTATDAADQVKTVMTVETTGETTPQVVKPAPVSGAAVGNAALARTKDKRVEAVRSCAAHPAATNPLLSVGSAVTGRSHHSLTWLFLVVAALAAGVAIGAIALRHRGAKSSRTSLEIVASTVAIFGTLATLAVAYLGAGVKDRPPPAVRMTVREVHARITHGAYMDKMRGVATANQAVPATALVHASGRTLDRLEIGNVVWLELDLTGYRNTSMRLQWALFHAGAGQPLIPATEQKGVIPVDDSSDVHSEFLPIWIGSPRVSRFRVEFRLLDRGQVRQIASTGAMRGITYRYAC
jgi:hypothetical protein